MYPASDSLTQEVQSFTATGEKIYMDLYSEEAGENKPVRQIMYRPRHKTHSSQQKLWAVLY
jgi:hypothetical protein